MKFLIAILFTYILPIAACLAQNSAADFTPQFRKKISLDISELDEKILNSKIGIKEQDLLNLEQSEKAIQEAREDLRELSKQKLYRYKNTFPPYHALLKKGSRVFSLDLNDIYLTQKDIIVIANEIIRGGSLAYLYDKEGKEKYIVITKEIDKIEGHLQIESSIDASQVYERDYKHKVQDYTFELEHSFNFHIENIKATYFSDIFQTDSTGARANRLEYRIFFPWRFPIDFGVSTSFQDGRYNNFDNGIEADWNAVYAGPYIRSAIIKEENFKLFMLFGLEKSFYFDVTESFQLSTNTWSALLESEIKIRDEFILFSLGIRQMRGHIKKSIIGDIEESATRRTNQSIDFSIGYRFGQFL